jgi:hypothetical protein
MASFGSASLSRERRADRDKARRSGVVLNSRGEAQLHGAFHGGFSAGYYNTVGSAEGWTPSSFSSSRSARAPVAQRAVADYLDEDDDQMAGVGVAARAEYDTLGLRAAAAVVGHAERATASAAAQPLPGTLLAELVRPVTDGIGRRLLRWGLSLWFDFFCAPVPVVLQSLTAALSAAACLTRLVPTLSPVPCMHSRRAPFQVDGVA